MLPYLAEVREMPDKDPKKIKKQVVELAKVVKDAKKRIDDLTKASKADQQMAALMTTLSSITKSQNDMLKKVVQNLR